MEALIEAAEERLLVGGLLFISVTLFAAALIFAFLFGTVRPRLLRAYRSLKRYRAENRALFKVNAGLKNDLLSGAEKIKQLEQKATDFEKELRRVDAIREKTEIALVLCKAELEEFR